MLPTSKKTVALKLTNGLEVVVQSPGIDDYVSLLRLVDETKAIWEPILKRVTAGESVQSIPDAEIVAAASAGIVQHYESIKGLICQLTNLTVDSFAERGEKAIGITDIAQVLGAIGEVTVGKKFFSLKPSAPAGKSR